MGELSITMTKGYRSELVRVECPECGSGGASSYPCWCSKCEDHVLMLPLQGRTLKNWNEVFS